VKTRLLQTLLFQMQLAPLRPGDDEDPEARAERLKQEARDLDTREKVGLRSLPGVCLVTWTVLAVINWTCF
jgi:hypothetical protein